MNDSSRRVTIVVFITIDQANNPIAAIAKTN